MSRRLHSLGVGQALFFHQLADMALVGFENDGVKLAVDADGPAQHPQASTPRRSRSLCVLSAVLRATHRTPPVAFVKRLPRSHLHGTNHVTFLPGWDTPSPCGVLPFKFLGPLVAPDRSRIFRSMHASFHSCQLSWLAPSSALAVQVRSRHVTHYHFHGHASAVALLHGTADQRLHSLRRRHGAEDFFCFKLCVFRLGPFDFSDHESGAHVSVYGLPWCSLHSSSFTTT